MGFARHAGLSGGLLRHESHDAVWHSPDLAFSQTCGYPFTHQFRGLLQYVATPHYACDGCDGANYSSFIFAREAKSLAKFSGATPAVNAVDSMSGNLALKLCFKDFLHGRDFFQPPLITGSHLNSLKAVREGRADLCAIDSVCVALAKKYRLEDLEGLTEIARSQMIPGLPYITRGGNVDHLRDALRKTFHDPQLSAARGALLLDGFSILPADAYDVIPQLEASL